MFYVFLFGLKKLGSVYPKLQVLRWFHTLSSYLREHRTIEKMYCSFIVIWLKQIDFYRFFYFMYFNSAQLIFLNLCKFRGTLLLLKPLPLDSFSLCSLFSVNITEQFFGQLLALFFQSIIRKNITLYAILNLDWTEKDVFFSCAQTVQVSNARLTSETFFIQESESQSLGQMFRVKFSCNRGHINPLFNMRI